MRDRRTRLTHGMARLALGGAALVLFLSGAASGQALGPLFGIDEEVTPQAQRLQLLPDDFFSSFPTARAQNIAVEADNLVFDADANTITALGNVRLSFNGYLASADRAVYDRNSGDLVLEGNAVVRDPEQVVYTGERIQVTGDFKEAFVRALEMQTPDGALITADAAEYRNNVEAILKNGTYAPCGYCVDEEGRKIGWRIKAASIILNQQQETLYLELPQLEVLGVPVASLPFLWMPDPTNPRATGFRFPRFDYSQDYGARVAVPYFLPAGENTDLWLTPMLMSRQAFMLDGEITHRFGPGSTSVRAAGLYQIDRSPFTGETGDRDWRGAIQTSGMFVPAENWRAGWSYLAFSDPGFIPDYKLDGFDTLNDVYVQYLDAGTFFDARIQEFVALGNVTPALQDQQGRTLPLIRLDSVLELGEDMGQIGVKANLIGVNRLADHTASIGGVPYVYGYQGNKVHAMIEADWSKQFVVPGGLVLTPYLGARLDGASYDGTSALLPAASSLFGITPIAALDIRFPFIGIDGASSSYLFEPIAQLSYRGSSTTLPGITNDNAQSFIFEDSNLFSFNRFTGSDRQETGLRANVGGQFMANFADGSWLRLIGGQSYQLAGVNGFSIFDHGQTGNSSGLENVSSFIVAGVQASFAPGMDIGGKVEFDPATASVIRGAVAAQLDVFEFTLDADYYYLAAQPARGTTTPTHTVSARLGIPLADYWRLSTGVDWNVEAGNWSEASLGAGYDDGYVSYGATYTATQDISTSSIEHAFKLNFNLKGLGGI